MEVIVAQLHAHQIVKEHVEAVQHQGVKHQLEQIPFLQLQFRADRERDEQPH